MSLPETLEALEARTLSPAEREALRRFMEMFEISDDDPLIVVLAMMAMNRRMADDLPDRMEAKAKETIELHAQTLREQSTYIAKELLASLANVLAETTIGHKLRRAQFAGVFLAGFIVGACMLWWLVH